MNFESRLKALEARLRPQHSCPSCNKPFPHIDRQRMHVDEQGNYTIEHMQIDPCPGQKRLLVLEELDCESWNRLAMKVLRESHNHPPLWNPGP